MSIEDQINTITSRHIAKLLTKLDKNIPLDQNSKEAIKAQFRMLQDDIIARVRKVNKSERKK